ncbi:MAG TPA: ABC transporter permease [Bryobacteraceae bacterium]|nr:ABC transporter permease [Bryobacteraceae bacterium]
MSLWRHITHGLRVFFDRSGAEQDVADEVEHYLDETVSALVTRGLSPEDARRQARLELGSPMLVRDEVRSYGWENVIGSLAADVRYGARRLRANPGFTLVSALTLALGIGASTAIFSAVNPILFEPLPYPHAGRLVTVWDIFQGARTWVTFHSFREIAERSRSFDGLAVMETWQPTMTSDAQPERLDGQSVSAGYFHTLGISPVLGRDFQAADDRFHGPKVVILSDALWRRRFSADGAIAGREVRLDDDLYTVIGVMPRNFENVLAPSSEIWTPLQYDPGHITTLDTQEWGHHLKMVGRLRAGTSRDQCMRELGRIARSPAPEFPRPPWAALKYGFIVDSMQDDLTRTVRPALVAVLGAVMLVLLIACVNVTNLLLARGAQRRGEFAMRAALGAGRPRLIRQLMTESLLLAVLGGTLGMLVAQFGLDALKALSPTELPRLSAIAVDGAVFAFAAAITTLVGLAVGLVPALQVSREDLNAGLRQSSQRATAGHQWTRRTLVVAEVALALVLLVSAGLLLRSVRHLFSVAPGFDHANLLTMEVQEAGRRYYDDSARRRFFAQALDAVRNVPGVESAAFTSLLPFGGDPFGEYGTHFESQRSYDAFRYAVTPGYFETMGIPLRSGRFLDDHDTAGAQPVVLISASLARREFKDQNPIGRRVHVGPMNRPWYTIAGVVGDVKQASLAESRADAVYLAPAQSWFADSVMSLVVRVRGGGAALVPAIRNAIWSVDKDQPIVRVATMDQLLAASAAARRFALIVFEAFALVALVLAATGIYGVLSGSVTERMREIGVRTALGASRRDIVALIVRQGMALTGAGILIGLAGASLASGALVTLLFAVSRLDPATYLGVIAVLAFVAGAACWIPAWRAAQVDPSITLRSE